MNSQVNSRKPRKLNRDQVLADLERGKMQVEIAKAQGVTKACVSKFVVRIKRHFKSVEELKEVRGDMLATLHALSSAAQEKVLLLINERLENKDLTEGLTLGEICRLLQSLGVNSGILFDKLRLETGLSTSNVGLAGLIKHAHHSGIFDSNGEFKASLVGPKPISRPKKNDTSTTLVENESNQ